MASFGVGALIVESAEQNIFNEGPTSELSPNRTSQAVSDAIVHTKQEMEVHVAPSSGQMPESYCRDSSESSINSIKN
jgi:hypothetical protein